jgi:GNAT superfamily N-acetyltransferase
VRLNKDGSRVLENIRVDVQALLSSSWQRDPTNYVTSFAGEIQLFGEDEEFVTIGQAAAQVVHLSVASDDGVPWFDVLDATNADTASCLELIETCEDDWTNWVRKTLEPHYSDLLILDRIQIKPSYRGKGFGLHAADALIRSLGGGAGIVTCIPAPYHLLENDREDKHLLNTASADSYSSDWNEAVARLRAYWSLLGFQPVPYSEICALSQARRRPTLEDAVRNYRSRKHRPGPRTHRSPFLVST